VAIALVVGFHLTLPVKDGGLVGVTLFFVLSGFLITRLLVDEALGTGHIALASFYRRRVRRLLPALSAAVIVIAAIALPSGQFGSVAQDLVLAMTYASNWARAAGDPMGLMNHSWSLGIEMQYYLIWPVALILAGRFVPLTSPRLALAILGLAAVSALIRVILSTAGASDDRVYFGTDTRAEALLAGSALGALDLAGRRRPPAWIGGGSLLLIFALALTPFPDGEWSWSKYTIVTVASLGLIASAMNAGTPRLGGLVRASAWLGERSYSIYIWHVPVILTLGSVNSGLPFPLSASILAALTLLLAQISYRSIERPFHRTTSRHVVSRRTVLSPGRELRHGSLAEVA
jgi:peptidoglycan/LPS O-acetylase OafA/YrhL